MSSRHVDPRRVALTRADGRAGLLWFLGLAVAGVLVRWLAPFGGAATGSFLSREVSSLNGLLLGAAPLVGIFRAYRQPRNTNVEPYGEATRPRIGGWPALIPAAAAFLAWVSAAAWSVGDPRPGVFVAFMVAASLGLGLECQRRLRGAHEVRDWTDPALDALRVQPVLLIAVTPLFLPPALGHALSNDAAAVLPAVIVLWLGCWQAYRGLTSDAIARPWWRRALASSYWAGGVILGLTVDPFDHPEMLAWYSVLPLVVAWLELERRQLRDARVAELLAAGQRERLAARYGPQLRPLGVSELLRPSAPRPFGLRNAAQRADLPRDDAVHR